MDEPEPQSRIIASAMFLAIMMAVAAACGWWLLIGSISEIWWLTALWPLFAIAGAWFGFWLAIRSWAVRLVIEVCLTSGW